MALTTSGHPRLLRPNTVLFKHGAYSNTVTSCRPSDTTRPPHPRGFAERAREHPRRADHRVPGQLQLPRRGEDPDRAALEVVHEHGLAEPELRGQAHAHVAGEPRRVEHDAERVAEAAVGV